MDKNVGGLDRTARLTIGSLLVIAVAAGFTGYLELGLTVGLLGLLVGGILLVTGAAQRCPLWLALRVNTFRR